MRRIIIPILLSILPFSLLAQTGAGETKIQREVTLYNPFKPTLREATKKSYLPDMSDTLHVTPEFNYEITPRLFVPVYSVTPIKASSVIAEPSPKLYKSYVNAGFGNFLMPFAEISITTDRSKKGVAGAYLKHLSSSGNIKLDNDLKVFAGYMDNEAAFFGKKYFKKNLFESTYTFNQFERYAYGYDPAITTYDLTKTDIRFNYINSGEQFRFYSTNRDSSSLSYDFKLKYNFFYQDKNLWQHNIEFSGFGAKEYKGFYAGAGVEANLFKLSPFLNGNFRKIISISPFVSKNAASWGFKLGLQVVAELSQEGFLSNPTMDDYETRLHFYPDMNFSFDIIPSYINFFAALTGKLENNQPLTIIGENPYIKSDGILYNLPNTDHELIVNAGLRGAIGTEGSYLLSSSYSIINNMLLFKNYYDYSTGSPLIYRTGSLFLPETDDAGVLNIHGELKTENGDKLSTVLVGNYYDYTLTSNDFAWNKPSWDASLNVNYNLRNKILAGAELSAIGKRSTVMLSPLSDPAGSVIEMPMHFNLNLSAEYRYTKALSFWIRLNNISYNRYNEWLFYPSMRFMGMAGFSYSL